MTAAHPRHSLTRPPVNRRSVLPDIIQFVVLIAILSYLLTKSAGTLGYNWQWYQVRHFLFTIGEQGFEAGPLLEGLRVTLIISGISMLLALLIGLLTALLRLSGASVARGCARLYLEVARNTPLLIQIYFIYFVLGPLLGLDRFPSAVLALSLFEGAYVSEIIRSGILSVSKGQREAGYSLGLGPYLTYRHIILPQAIRNTLPPLTNQAISLIKDSALVSTIAIYDLTMQAQRIIAETFLSFEIWFTIAFMYLFINMILSLTVYFMEKRIQAASQY